METSDLREMVKPVAQRFLALVPPLMNRLAGVDPVTGVPVEPSPMMLVEDLRTSRRVSREFMSNIATLSALGHLNPRKIPVVDPRWVEHLLDEVVEAKIDLRGNPLTYLLTPHPASDVEERAAEYQEGVFQYLLEAAEKFAGFHRSWTDDPDATYMYDQVRRHTLDQLLSTASVNLPRIIGSLTPADFRRWYEEGREEGIPDPDVEYLAQRAALYVAGLSSMASALLGGAMRIMQDTEESAEEFQENPDLFRDAIFLLLEEATRTLAGEIPDDDPLRVAANEGRELRETFEAARTVSGMSLEQANREAARVVAASGEDVNPARAWLPIGPDGATDLDLAQRAWLWENYISGSNLGYDIYTAIAGEEPE